MRSAISNNRQLELLKKHYDIDEINKLVDITFRYEKATDVLVEDLGKNEHPLFEWDVISRVNKVIQSLPLGYRVNISFSIDDYQEFTPEIVLDSFKDELELNSFSVRKSRKKTWLISCSLVIIGIILLIIMIAASNYNRFGSGAQSDILIEVIDIAAWVFIWEAVSMIFLEHSEETSVALILKNRIASIKLVDSKNNDVILEENNEEIFKEWIEEKPIHKIGRTFMLFSSSAFICMAFFGIYNAFEISMSGNLTSNEILIESLNASIGFLFHIIAGICGMLFYSGSRNKLTKLVGPTSFVLLVFLIASIVIDAINGSVSGVVISTSSIVFNLFYIFGFAVMKDKKHKNANSGTI